MLGPLQRLIDSLLDHRAHARTEPALDRVGPIGRPRRGKRVDSVHQVLTAVERVDGVAIGDSYLSHAENMMQLG
jgi:hypothetical protein